MDAQDLAEGTIHSWKWVEGLASFCSCHCTGWSYHGRSCAGCASLKHCPGLAHVGQHLLQKECVKAQEEISFATACGFCGDRVTCSTQVLMRNKRTHALVTLMLFDCPSQPAKLWWNTLAKEYARSPCMNHLVRCPLCTKTVWSYCMAQHYADVHDTAWHPDLMHIADAEQEAVQKMLPHKAKKKKVQCTCAG